MGKRSAGTIVKTSRRGRNRRSKNARAVGEFAGDAYELAQRAYAGVKAVARLINIEEKCFDYSSSGALTTAGAVTYVSGIQQGLDYANRVGDSIKVQRISCRFQVYNPANFSAGSSDHVRVILVRDNENAASAPAVSDILESGSISAPVKWLNKGRFRVLYDEVCDMQTAHVLDTATWDFPLERHIKFRGTGSTAASAGEGSMWLLAMCTNATYPSSLVAYIRLMYTDD